MIEFNYDLFKKISKDVFTCDSPTGFTSNAVKLVENYIKDLGYDYKVLNNGALEVSIQGKDNSKTVATVK